MRCASIYGFGSFFRSDDVTGDVDFLIVHQSVEEASCRFGIQCKKLIQAKLPNAHITLLSKREEKSLAFIRTAKAEHLGDVDDNNFEDQTLAILTSKVLI